MPVSHHEFAELVTRNQRRVYGFILSVVPSSVDADDIFQETCLTLWRRIEDFDPSGDFLRWAFGIARNVIRNTRVKHLRDRHVFSDETIALLAEHRADHQDDLDQRHRALRVCLDELADPHRQLVDLCYAGDQTIDAISAQLNRKPNAVYQQLHRIRKALLKCIETRVAKGAAHE